MTERQRSAGVSFSVWAMFQPEAQRFFWLSGTILGRDVVPEVCSTSATSSGPASLTAEGGPPPGSPISVKLPAPRSGSGVSVTILTPSFFATSMAGEVLPFSTIRSFAPRSDR